MAEDNRTLDNNIRVASASITSLSIFVALSAAIMGFLVSRESLEFQYNAAVISSGCLMLAIVLFLIAIEFFILCIYHCEHIGFFGLLGSCAYGLGVMFMVVGISVALAAFQVKTLSYIFLSFALLGYLAFYGIRTVKLGREDYLGIRLAARMSYILVIATGYGFLITLGG